MIWKCIFSSVFLVAELHIQSYALKRAWSLNRIKLGFKMYPRNSDTLVNRSVELTGCLHGMCRWFSARVLCKLWLFGYNLYLPSLTHSSMWNWGRAKESSGNCRMMIMCLLLVLHFRLQRLKFKKLCKLHVCIPLPPRNFVKYSSGRRGQCWEFARREMALTLDLLN